MIEIDGVELRTAAQWEKKHRHVKKGQLGKGVERTWRSRTETRPRCSTTSSRRAPGRKRTSRRSTAAAAPTPRRSARPMSAGASRAPPRGTASQRPSRLLGGSHRRGNLAGGPPRPHRLPVVRSRLRSDCRSSVAAYPIRRQFRMVLLLSLGCAL